MRNFLKLVTLCYVLLITHNVAKAQNQEAAAPYVPGELIVKFKAGNTSTKTNHLATKMQAQVVNKLPGLEVELWKVNQSSAKLDVNELVEQYKNHPDIDFIEPNYLYSITEMAQPDSAFDQQWGLNNDGALTGSTAGADIDAIEGWAIQSESPSIVVGILDTGVDWRHPDLVNNIWQNLAEDFDGDGVVLIQNEEGKWVFDEGDENGIDDDGNGYIDDFIGWNFVDDNNQPFDYETFEAGEYVQSHGTHVAGIIGATGDNGIGISGVTKSVQLAPLKFLTDDSKSKGTAWHAAAAIDYAVKMGMQISNNSWGGGKSTLSTLILRAIEAAELNNHLFITAAGNGGWDKIGDDIIHYYPSNYDFDNIISVANTNFADALNPSSNYSVYHVDLAAPGTGIYSCMPNDPSNIEGTYDFNSGTSMAAPMVAGACALLWEKSMTVFGEVKVAHIKNLIVEHVDELPELKDKVGSSGRLNLHKALAATEDTSYINQYKVCRNRDSLALRIIHNTLDLDIVEYAWHTNNSSMETWKGIELNRLGCVSKLDITHNIKKEIPAAIGDLSDLTYLSIAYGLDVIDDALSNAIPLEIFNLKKLKHLQLNNNNIAGSIPPQIGQLVNLEHLNLNRNLLTGNIPTEMWELIKLSELYLISNQLNGVVPNTINQLKNLYTLVLSGNQFSGSLPTFNDNLKLRNISLSYNNFSGEIPELLQPRRIYALRLNNNQLTGSLNPLLSWFYTDIENISSFNVSNNALSGCYDPAFVRIGLKEYDGEDGLAFRNNSVSDGNQFGINNAWEDFIINDGNSCWASTTTKVWPGDMNNDGLVDVNDFVFYELAVENTGPTRDNTGVVNNNGNTIWEGQLCPNWATNVWGVNSKHQDANGDGIVDILDYQVIVDNMGQENPNHIETNHLTFYDNGIELEFRQNKNETAAHQANLNTTEEFIFEVYVNNVEGGADVLDLSAKVAFNDAVEVKSFEFTNDCLVQSKNQYFLDETKTQLEFSFKKEDIVIVACEEALARVLIVVVEETPIDGDKFLQFKVDDSINSKDGDGINRTTPLNSYSSLSIGTNDALNVQLTTKPERCKDGGLASAAVSGGQLPYTYTWISKDDMQWTYDSTLEVDGLVSGCYSLTVTDAVGAIQKILFDIDDQLEYDENGLPLNCETYIETYCPEDLNLVDEIVEDTYNAANNIYTDGTITEDTEVELRAGEFIQLAPGFRMENNTSLRIRIEDCNGSE